MKLLEGRNVLAAILENACPWAESSGTKQNVYELEWGAFVLLFNKHTVQRVQVPNRMSMSMSEVPLSSCLPSTLCCRWRPVCCVYTPRQGRCGWRCARPSCTPGEPHGSSPASAWGPCWRRPRWKPSTSSLGLSLSLMMALLHLHG